MSSALRHKIIGKTCKMFNAHIFRLCKASKWRRHNQRQSNSRKKSTLSAKVFSHQIFQHIRGNARRLFFVLKQTRCGNTQMEWGWGKLRVLMSAVRVVCWRLFFGFVFIGRLLHNQYMYIWYMCDKLCVSV